MTSDKKPRAPKSGAALQNMVLAYVGEHPNVKLSAIEKGIGAARIEVAQVIQELTRQGNLRKDEETGEYNVFL